MWSEHYNNPGNAPEHPEEALAAFALNALDDAEFQAVFHHVIKCLHCQEVLLGFQETSARLTGSAPEVSLPAGIKGRILAAAIGRAVIPAAPADARWSVKRLRRWLMPAAIGALSVSLAVSIGIMVVQQQEIDQLSATYGLTQERPLASDISSIGAATSAQSGAAYSNANLEGDGALEIDAEVDLVKQEMAEVVEASVLSAQPETEKVPMSSPMGTEPKAKGVLIMEPSGRQGFLMVSGMPPDSYQIWLAQDGRRMLVDRIVVNSYDVNSDYGIGVRHLDMDESLFHFQQVMLTPDERHGPTQPTGEQILTALIRQGPSTPPR